jgi:uncharacterized protein YndB with AHSA1/START domain
MSDDVLEVSVHIAATPETVFGFFTDPGKYAEWMGSSAHLEPEPGGIYRVHMREGVEALGEFLEVEPAGRVVFSWGWAGDPVVPPGSSRVEVTFRAEAGGTLVTLRHRGLPSAEQRAHHRAGWAAYLDRLAARATGRDPGPDPNAG